MGESRPLRTLKCNMKNNPNHKYSFFPSVDFRLGNTQIIVYPDVDAAESYKGFGYSDMQAYLEKTLNIDPEFFKDMTYGISFIWNFEGRKMLDFWKFTVNYVDDRSGPLADVKIYQELEPTTALGTASGNTLLVLGIEETLRRKSESLEQYLAGPAPQLPFGLQIDQEFFVSQ